MRMADLVDSMLGRGRFIQSSERPCDAGMTPTCLAFIGGNLPYAAVERTELFT